jgi:hypothetical protein
VHARYVCCIGARGAKRQKQQMAIDTLAYVKELEAAGVPRDQAEAQVRALAQHALPDLATKDDIRLAIAELKADLKADLAEIKGRLSNLPSTAQLLFMQIGIILAIFAGAFGLLKMAGH